VKLLEAEVPVLRLIEGAAWFKSHDNAEISAALQLLLADASVLYLKTKSFQLDIRGRRFTDYRLLLGQHADQILDMTDALAKRAREIAGASVSSASEVASNPRLKGNNEQFVTPKDMLDELWSDNRQLAWFLRSAQQISAGRDDVATASLLATLIAETECRTSILSRTVLGL
jgi:starvation-inducible DNA-binding protein